jgi:hypothetical protein
MAGLDPAIPLEKAPPCHMIGIAGSGPAMTGGESTSSKLALKAGGDCGAYSDPVLRR